LVSFYFCNLKDGISDRLDFAVAYLRRVHHYLYYSGRQCKDESQILITASGVQFRSELLASSSAVAMRSSRLSSDGDNDYSARDNEDIVDDDGNDENEYKNNDSGQLDVSSTLSPSIAATSSQLRKLEFFDARTEENISASKARCLRSRTPASERSSGTADENDADAILFETNKVSVFYIICYSRLPFRFYSILYIHVAITTLEREVCSNRTRGEREMRISWLRENFSRPQLSRKTYCFAAC
jgi:hypothetical protein